MTQRRNDQGGLIWSFLLMVCFALADCSDTASRCMVHDNGTAYLHYNDYNVTCHVNSTCSKTSLGQEQCHCSAGLMGNGVSSCEDIDECRGSKPPCGLSQICINTIGNFKCNCKLGWVINQEQRCEERCPRMWPMPVNGIITVPTPYTYINNVQWEFVTVVMDLNDLNTQLIDACKDEPSISKPFDDIMQKEWEELGLRGMAEKRKKRSILGDLGGMFGLGNSLYNSHQVGLLKSYITDVKTKLGGFLQDHIRFASETDEIMVKYMQAHISLNAEVVAELLELSQRQFCLAAASHMRTMVQDFVTDLIANRFPRHFIKEGDMRNAWRNCESGRREGFGANLTVCAETDVNWYNSKLARDILSELPDTECHQHKFQKEMFFLSNWESLCIYNYKNGTHFTSRINCAHDRRVQVSIDNKTICGNCVENNIKEGICVCKRYKEECELPVKFEHIVKNAISEVLSYNHTTQTIAFAMAIPIYHDKDVYRKTYNMINMGKLHDNTLTKVHRDHGMTVQDGITMLAIESLEGCSIGKNIIMCSGDRLNPSLGCGWMNSSDAHCVISTEVVKPQYVDIRFIGNNTYCINAINNSLTTTNLQCRAPSNAFCIQVIYPMNIGGRKLYYTKNRIDLYLDDPYAEFLQPEPLPETNRIQDLQEVEQQLEVQLLKMHEREKELTEQVSNYISGMSTLNENYQDMYWDVLFKAVITAGVVVLLVGVALMGYLRFLREQRKRDLGYVERKVCMTQSRV
ncbi:uncharacterized protein LOC125721471 [Brienomyrus brachyistius]|uniref:uncharacterized protein LOC125721471 n=1 Tax=Brienomyrus brachyistius TaxID=42636 RepID=UPI0020B3228A|nr:uncharacterized protein LOC125721471 [Brienomyrus brachyistius]